MAPNLCFNINIGLAWVVVASMVIRSVVGEVVPFLDPVRYVEFDYVEKLLDDHY